MAEERKMMEAALSVGDIVFPGEQLAPSIKNRDQVAGMIILAIDSRGQVGFAATVTPRQAAAYCEVAAEYFRRDADNADAQGIVH